MARTTEPRTGIAPGTPRHTQPVYLPVDVFESMRRGVLQESVNFGRTVTNNEFITRAIIDRIGKVFGTRYANRLYRQYFNGLAALKSNPDELPEIKTLDVDFIG